MNLGDHIKTEHGDDSYKSAVLKAKEEGNPKDSSNSLMNILNSVIFFDAFV